MTSRRGQTESRAAARWVACGLTLLVFVAFAGVAWNGFVDFDDDAYVTRNPQVSGGLTAESVRWAFTTFHMGNYHPLTWLSHMLDCEWFGLEPAGHHRVSVALHAAAAVALFYALLGMTACTWRSAAVAALFAVHPLRVESVAWVAERKDVLAALFWMLTLVAYVGYARRGGLLRYLVVVATFALGLMAKPMLVTLPFVLLLLDGWPLARAGDPRQRGRLVVEKLPLVALAGGIAWITSRAQQAAGAVGSLDVLDFGQRAQNAVTSCVAYVWDTLWPTGLAFFYPHASLVGGATALSATAGAAGLSVAAFTVVALVWRRRHPWLAVGWLWYLGTLVPVLGLVQVGEQARADRYTYLPSVGLLIVLVWGVAAIADRLPRLRAPIAVATMLALTVCVVLTARQVRYWRDTRALAERALAVTERNYRALDLLGLTLEREGDHVGAVEVLRAALSIQPSCTACRLNLATSLGILGETTEAEALYEAALRDRPALAGARAHNGLGALKQARGELDEARRHLEQAIELEPRYAEAHNNLGVVWERAGDRSRARQAYERALEAAPDYAIAHKNLGGILQSEGALEEAARQFELAIAAAPRMVQAHFKLAVVRAMQDDLPAAARGFERVLELDPDSVDANYNLGLVLAAAGETARSRVHLQRALTLDPGHEGARRALGAQ